VSLVWAVPVVAAAVATVLVVRWARRLEDEAAALVTAVRHLRDVSPRLAAVRDAVAETDDLASGFRRRHQLEGDGGDEGAASGDS
jgi:uncharacterized protein involved in exopolysaccharide biosynthesis